MKIKFDNVPIWGGLECTVHRLRNQYGDQLVRSGHHERISDLDLIAGLGIKTLRYHVDTIRCLAEIGTGNL